MSTFYEFMLEPYNFNNLFFINDILFGRSYCVITIIYFANFMNIAFKTDDFFNWENMGKYVSFIDFVKE